MTEAGSAGDVVTVVVPAFGGADRLARLLRGLDAQASAEAMRLPVIVVDDASPTPVVVDSTDLPALHLSGIRRSTNGGPGAARNTGLAAVSTPWVAFMDADVEGGPGWLVTLLDLVTDANGIDGLEGPVVGTAAGATPFDHSAIIRPDAGQHGGANVVYRTHSLSRLGGFSEDFYDPIRHIHFREDSELRFRAANHGLTVGYAPNLVAHHPSSERSMSWPLRAVRRYYFDPLLSARYPDEFKSMNQKRGIGRYSLRRARHDAALAVGWGTILLASGIATRSRYLVGAGSLALSIGWTGNAAALVWGRAVKPSDYVAVVGMSLAVPWVYLWHYYRGVIAFRHFARM